MSKSFALVLIVASLLFTACANHYEPLPSNVKSFEDEDRLIITALYAKSQGDMNSTISLFELLYEKSDKKEYRNEELIAMIQSRQNERALKKIEEYKAALDEGETDVELERLKIAALMELQSYNEAKTLLLALVEHTKAASEYQQIAAIYMNQGRYEFALRYLQSAYAINYDEGILDKMAIILYVNLNRKAEAVSHLETHIRLHGCSEIICTRLGSFYSEENNVDGMLRVYLRLYESTKDEKYAQTVVKLYNYKKDAISLIQFLEKSGSDDALLLQLYISTKNYPKVVSLADKLYREDGDSYYLGQSAIFEYEGAEDKHNEAMVASVMEKLKRVIEYAENAMYLNYLGYLLIDHEIDIEGGMAYVRKALEVEPESPYYLDSLAWGYYKQGKCKKALKLMEKVQINLGKEDAEVSAHLKAIKACIKMKGK
ncbi:MAG: tetratricopeptide repeat protein [Campylobacterales bacterium]|nr:tetratricopeptide repeat protein [Campylobacterales bacterium]